MRILVLLGALLLVASAVAAAPGPLDQAIGKVNAALDDPEATLADPLAEEGNEGEPGQGAPDESPGFDNSIREAIEGKVMMYSAVGAVVATLGVVGFSLVTRYISPKEALKNPQRAMIYGFVRATPGAHLKQLSEEFGMKSSSILWHIRKLESADLVRSERANGYRVFFPVEGGIELRRVSRAVTALQNANARRAFGHLQANPGKTATQIARATTIHPGTVRWHLRKMREFGLIEELMSDQASKYFPTPLGTRALQSVEGTPVGENIPSGASSPLAAPESD